MKNKNLKIRKSKDTKIKNILTIIALIILVSLGINYAFFAKSKFIYDVVASIVLLGIFYKVYNKLNQDYVSYLFFLLLLVLHNSSLYGLNFLGLKFENYIHFFGGFTLAIIADRLFIEKFSRIKRFALIIIFSLGIGAIHEIVEWIGFITLGFGEGMFFFGAGDFEPWRNTIIDLIFNFLGSTLMGLITLLRKK